MRTSKAVLALWPTLWALAAGCRGPETFRGVPDADRIAIQGTGGNIGLVPTGDGTGGLSGSGGEGTGGAIEPGGTGGAGEGTGGDGAGGTVDAGMDPPSTGGSGGGAGGGRDASPESSSADARDLPADLPTLLTYRNHCLPARWTAAASVQSGAASNAIDGDPATLWQTTSPQAGTEFFQVDLWEVVRLNQVVLDNTAGNQTDYPRGYRIMVSTDGTTFPTLAATASAGPSGAITTIDFPAVNARALRIFQSGLDPTYWWTIRELRLGCQSVPTPPSGAFDPLDSRRWKVSASASESGSPPASAVDGDFSTRWTSGARQQGNEWFQVDLGASTPVSEIWLSTRTNPEDFPAQYNVEVSTDNQTFTSAANGPGQASITKIVFARRSARYVRIRQTGITEWWWGIDQLTILP